MIEVWSVLRPAIGVGRTLHQHYRRLLVLVHRAYFVSPDFRRATSDEHFFIKMTNLSPKRPVEVSHVWFEADPPVHVLARPLNKLLQPDETYETYISVAEVPDVPNPEKLVRVRLSNGKVVKGRRNDKVPSKGTVAGWRPIDHRSPPVTGY